MPALYFDPGSENQRQQDPGSGHGPAVSASAEINAGRTGRKRSTIVLFEFRRKIISARPRLASVMDENHEEDTANEHSLHRGIISL